MTRLAKWWAAWNPPSGWWLIPGGILGGWLWITLLKMAFVS